MAPGAGVPPVLTASITVYLQSLDTITYLVKQSLAALKLIYPEWNRYKVAVTGIFMGNASYVG